MPFRLDRSLVRTLLFSLAVVTFVIATYQTIIRHDDNALRDNYWLFMISFSAVMLFRYLGRREPPVPPAPPAAPARPKGAATRRPKP